MQCNWMIKNLPGFSDLTHEEIQAISEFVLLWGYFESKLLNAQGSPRTINALVEKLAASPLSERDQFSNELDYMKNRYFVDGKPTHHFHHLHLRKNDFPELVEHVLSTESRSYGEELLTLLIIVLRFRNNLFHGIKWEYELSGQFENFQHANSILRKVLSCSSELDIHHQNAT